MKRRFVLLDEPSYKAMQLDTSFTVSDLIFDMCVSKVRSGDIMRWFALIVSENRLLWNLSDSCLYLSKPFALVLICLGLSYVPFSAKWTFTRTNSLTCKQKFKKKVKGSQNNVQNGFFYFIKIITFLFHSTPAHLSDTSQRSKTSTSFNK